MTPSIAADETSMAESIKRLLASHGNSSDALTFADLYSQILYQNCPWKHKKQVVCALHAQSHLRGSEEPKGPIRFDDFHWGIDEKFVKFDKNMDGYALPDTVSVSGSTRIMVRELCELGWLFRKAKGYISESMDRFPAEDVGTVGQAFCAALQDELSEYYKLLAVLEAQSMNPIPLVSESASSGSYLSLRRLSEAFGAIHMHAQHGDPLVHDFMKRLLHRVCSPLFEMVRSWVLEGELEDILVSFFILAQPVKAESLWREGYRLHAGMLPSFISQSLAERILRTGKSINFLRVCCEDRGWADAATESAAAAGTTTTRGALGYGETSALESLYLMDTVGPELSEPANTISSFKLAGLLESAIRSSNATYYIMFEVLEVSWSTFVNEMEAAKDLDDLLAAQETYLDSIVENQADRLYEGIFELQSKTVESCRDKGKSRLHPSDKTSKPGSWVSEGRKAITQRAIEFLRNMEQDLDVIGKEYSSLLEGFISQLPLQQHIDLKFLLFRLDFNDICLNGVCGSS
ncbi:spindle pole body component 98 [Actinidia rufa]|uniref:Spindle pole body component 98 n=1 Tax=Actinidia rufa TaxID=165716 RepID=A0A7J0FMA2_9ERIC|nr:spindle pole body component 98 [Actinidia rufa]